MIFEKIRERLELYRFDIQKVVSKVLEKYGFPYESVVQDEIHYELDNFFENKDTIDIINQVEAEYKDVLSNVYYHFSFERRINEVIPMLESQLLYGTISLIKDLKAENDILRSYLPQPPKGE